MSTIHVGGIVVFGTRCKTLEEAFAKAFQGDEIVLHKNIFLNTNIPLKNGVILKGNGHTITTNKKQYGFIAIGIKTEIENLTIKVSKQSAAIYAENSNLQLEHVKISYAKSNYNVREKFNVIQMVDKKKPTFETGLGLYDCTIGSSILINYAVKVKIVNSDIGSYTAKMSGIRAEQIISQKNNYINVFLNGRETFSEDDTSHGNLMFMSFARITHLLGKIDLEEQKITNKELRSYVEVQNTDNALLNRTCLVRFNKFKGQVTDLQFSVGELGSLADNFSLLEIMGNSDLTIKDSVLPEGRALFYQGNLALENTQDELDWEYSPTETTVANRNSTSKLFNASQNQQQSALEKLNTLIGQTTVKTRLKEIISTATMQNYRRINGMVKNDSDSQFSNHMVFAGDAGTGKTTFGKLVAQALYEGGVLKENKFVYAEVKDFVDKYVGATREKAHQKVMSALNGVLFIDEAYGFAEQPGSTSHNHEAIQQIITDMEANRDKLIVILAGYTRDMKEFFASDNEGLPSRFNTWIEFENYSINELCQIMQLQLDNQGALYDEVTLSILQQGVAKLSEEAKTNGRSNGNGRFVRNYVQKVLESRDTRLAENISEINNYDASRKAQLLNMIIPTDVKKAINTLHAQYQIFNS